MISTRNHGPRISRRFSLRTRCEKHARSHAGAEKSGAICAAQAGFCQHARYSATPFSLPRHGDTQERDLQPSWVAALAARTQRA